jgi:hypothetical protein
MTGYRADVWRKLSLLRELIHVAPTMEYILERGLVAARNSEKGRSASERLLTWLASSVSCIDMLKKMKWLRPEGVL